MSYWEGFKKIIKENPILIATGIVVLLSLYIDLSHSGLINEKLLVLYNMICEIGRSFGLSYTKSLELISGSFGVMLTVTNIILTLTTNMANRAENYVFGFSREEINFKDSKTKENIKRIWVVSAPILLILVLNIGFCAVAYVTMILSYISVISTVRMFLDSFDSEKDMKKIIEKLKKSVSKIKLYDSKEYEQFLTKFLYGNDKADYLEKICKVTRAVVDEAIEKDEATCFHSIYCYFSVVIIPQMEKDIDKILKIIDDTIYYLDVKYNTISNKGKLEVVFAAIMFSIGNIANDKHFTLVLDIILKYSERSDSLIKDGKGKLLIEWFELEIGWVLIICEAWLWGVNKFEDAHLKRELIKVWEYGQKYLNKKNQVRINEILSLWEVRRQTKTYILNCLGEMQHFVELLKEARMFKKGASIVFELWKNA